MVPLPSACWKRSWAAACSRSSRWERFFAVRASERAQMTSVQPSAAVCPNSHQKAPSGRVWARNSGRSLPRRAASTSCSSPSQSCSLRLGTSTRRARTTAPRSGSLVTKAYPSMYPPVYLLLYAVLLWEL